MYLMKYPPPLCIAQLSLKALTTPLAIYLAAVVVNWINFDSIYLLHSDLHGGLGYSTFEGGPDRLNRIQTVLTSTNNLKLQYLNVSKEKIMPLCRII